MLKGRVVLDTCTKDLVKRIKANQIAIINHTDIDQVAGHSLVQKGVKAVINTGYSISGKYPNRGPSVLVEAGVPLFDICSEALFFLLEDGDYIYIRNGDIYWHGYLVGRGIGLDGQLIKGLLHSARNNLEGELDSFIDNTIVYARRDKELLFDLPLPNIDTDLDGCHALVVVRGADYKEDLRTVKYYIRDIKPAIIAVDGGADACLENGYLPDIIIGDMDSVSDQALQCGAEVVVHAYPDGTAPGLGRVEELGIEPIIFPAPGTSEDIALLLAYEKGAELITAVGTHTNVIDFLEKGRPGMGSTFLVRLKIGGRLVDAKGISRLYGGQIRGFHLLEIFFVMFLPVLLIAMFSEPVNHLVQLIVLRLSVLLQF